MQYQLITAMRNEGPFIIEWLAHHRVVGFNNIVVCTNDCNDLSDNLVEALSEVGVCVHLPITVPKDEFPQRAAYRTVDKSGLISGEDWAMILDSDEFLNVHIADHSVAALADALPSNVDLLALNWMTFGSSGLLSWTPNPVTEQFTQSVEPDRPLNGGVKSLVRRPANFGPMSLHAPIDYRGDSEPYVVNASLNRIVIDPQDYRNLWKPLHHLAGPLASHELAQINHYGTMTPDSYLLRQKRGLGWGNSSRQRHSQEYFDLRQKNPVPELSISRYFDARSAEEARIRNHTKVARIEADILSYYRESIVALDCGTSSSLL